MKLLIIGGTRFVGRHLVEYALARGHEVTLFYRGKSNPDIFPQAEHLHGDRDSDLALLDGRTWDACIDTCGYIPRHVRQSAGHLVDSVELYAFISTISVYANDPPPPPNGDESLPLQTLEDEETEEITGETYGGLKVLCERAAEAIMGERLLVIRPGFIVGPYDPTDRFEYWLDRLTRGGEVFVAGAPDRSIQFIDGRDLGIWTIHMVEANQTGIYNAVGPNEPLTWGAWLEAVRAVTSAATGVDATFTWGDDAFMESVSDLQPNLPLYVPHPYANLLAINAAKAKAEGLTTRPTDVIIRDTLAWRAAHPLTEPRRAGITSELEQELLKRWHQQHP
jgi:2'-hydroxyisoflavone reductase